MTVLDPTETPPFAGQPPIPDVYYDCLARRWGIDPQRLRAPGHHFHVTDRLGQPLASAYVRAIWAWRSERSRWLISVPRYADRAREAWRTTINPTTGWPVGLHGLIGPDPGAGPGPSDGWVLLIWPETLRPVGHPLLCKRVVRLRPRNARRLPDDLRARADHADAFQRGEMWVIFDSAGRQVLTWLWTRAYTERVRSVGVETAEGHRNRGLAKTVLSVATRDLLAEGLLPTYGARVNNPASQRVALSVGYLPVARDLLLIEKA